MKKMLNNRGVTLIGLIMVVLLIAILSAAVLIWIDPGAIVGNAEDSKREQDVLAIANAISEYVNDHKGALPVLGSVTTDKKTLCFEQGGSTISCGGSTEYCLRIADEDFYNKYLRELPIDPDKTSNTDTGYYLQKDSNGFLVVGACSVTGSSAVTKTTSVKVTCDAYAGGYCWYLSASAGSHCDAVCASNDKICVEKAQYASDVDINGTGFCALNRDIVDNQYICGSGCAVTTADSPGNYNGASTCMYREYPLDCDSKNVNYFHLCPCE